MKRILSVIAIVIATTMATAGFAREDEDSKRIQTANEVIPKGKFITDIGEIPARFVMVYKGKVYTCGNIVKRRDIPIGCEQNPDK